MTKEQQNLEHQRALNKRMKRLRARWNGKYPEMKPPGYMTESDETHKNEIQAWKAAW